MGRLRTALVGGDSWARGPGLAALPLTSRQDASSRLRPGWGEHHVPPLVRCVLCLRRIDPGTGWVRERLCAECGRACACCGHVSAEFADWPQDEWGRYCEECWADPDSGLQPESAMEG